MFLPKKNVCKICLLGDKIVFIFFSVFFLEANCFRKKNNFLRIYFFVLKVNCFRNILVISKNNRKNRKKYKSFITLDNKNPCLFEGLKKRKCFFLLKQNCFEKIFQFIENFDKFCSKRLDFLLCLSSFYF